MLNMCMCVCSEWWRGCWQAEPCIGRPTAGLINIQWGRRGWMGTNCLRSTEDVCERTGRPVVAARITSRNSLRVFVSGGRRGWLKGRSAAPDLILRLSRVSSVKRDSEGLKVLQRRPSSIRRAAAIVHVPSSRRGQMRHAMAAECKHLLPSLAMPPASQGNYRLLVLSSASWLLRWESLAVGAAIATPGFTGGLSRDSHLDARRRACCRSRDRSSSLEEEQRTSLSFPACECSLEKHN